MTEGFDERDESIRTPSIARRAARDVVATGPAWAGARRG